jgi:outer membrane protein assembly factor BamB
MRRLAATLFVLSLAVASARAGDWVSWRGPEHNGVSRERDLPDRWSPDLTTPDNNVIWRAPYGSRSAPLVMAGRVYLIDDADQGGINEQERIVCLEEATGKLLWERRYNVFLTDIVSSRVGWTNLACDPETGYVYAHGTQGFLICLDKDGKTVWERSLTEECGHFCGYGGRLTSPIVDSGLVILGFVNMGYGDQARGANRFLAVDKLTGQIVWWNETGHQVMDTYYSNPVVGVVNGERLFFSGGGDGWVHAFKVHTGEKVWSYPVAVKAINASPVVDGSRVYFGNGEENFDDSSVQGKVICLDAAKVKDGKPEVVWQVDRIRASFASPVLHEGRLYFPDEFGTLYCLDANTGTQHWKIKYGNASRGSPVWADGKIYVPDVNAHFVILKPEDKRCKRLNNVLFVSDSDTVVEVNGSPAIANGRLFVATADFLYCVGKKDHHAAADPISPAPEEPKPEADAKPAKLLGYPGDVTLLPGGSVSLVVRAYDAKGRFLKNVPAKWSLPQPPIQPGAKAAGPPLKGSITDDGKLTVDSKMLNQQGPAVATAFGLQARVRVRVIPPIPFEQNFERVPEGRTPGGWVNCQGKFVVEKKDGSMVLRKTTANPNPLLAKAFAYMGRPSDTDYTVEADLMGGRHGENLPDMGVVANRYSFVLSGNKQWLRILSWEALPRVEKTIPFEWKADTWYRMKLRVDIDGDKAIVRGKIWKRDDQEPKDWTIETSDPHPNREGSPGLYGYAVGVHDNELCPIWYDNISVTRNDKKQ